MALLGSDPEQLDALARKFDEESERIDSIITGITTQLSSTQWVGTDRDQFENQWNTTSTSQLRQVISSLNDAAGNCRKQADQQRQTSSA